MHRLTPVSLCVLLAACGASVAPLAPSTSSDAAPVRGAPLVDASGAGMGVEGLHGTLSPREAQRALGPYMAEITGCFAMRSMSFEELGGSLRMRIRVSDDGAVLAVHPEDSTVGDREVERCVSDAIAEARFPRPHGGGEAEVHWSLSVDPPESARQPTTWDPSRVARVVRRRAAALERGATSPRPCRSPPTSRAAAASSRRAPPPPPKPTPPASTASPSRSAAGPCPAPLAWPRSPST